MLGSFMCSFRLDECEKFFLYVLCLYIWIPNLFCLYNCKKKKKKKKLSEVKRGDFLKNLVIPIAYYCPEKLFMFSVRAMQSLVRSVNCNIHFLTTSY